jgi:hypothetical protein
MCGDSGGGRGDSGGGDGFVTGRGDDDCRDDINGDGGVDGDSGNGDSGDHNRAESIMLEEMALSSVTKNSRMILTRLKCTTTSS